MKRNMFKIIITLILFLIIIKPKVVFGQTFITPIPTVNSPDCDVDANDNRVGKSDLVRSVFRIQSPTGQCTGTLINRNTWGTEVGQYYITAWHCFVECSSGNSKFDINSSRFIFTFNFQAIQNRHHHVFSQNVSGNIMSIKRNVELIERVVCNRGDFALLKILGDPIPPHFNVYYAGWNPNSIYLNLWGPSHLNISHPKGSIKKAAQPKTLARVNPEWMFIEYGCHTVTKLIDFFLGWTWGRRWSTERVCNYIQVPFIDTRFFVRNYQWGTTETGSSGSSLFGSNDRIVGTLSEGTDGMVCNTSGGFDYYSQFADSYFKRSIRNTLNPSNKWEVDQIGIPGRQIDCHQNIDYRRYQGFDLFPGSWYQAENRITLNTEGDITMGVANSNPAATPVQALRVLTGADYELNAGGAINLEPGFSVDLGSTFTVNPGRSCNIYSGPYRKEATSGGYETQIQAHLLEKMKNIEMPEYLNFEESQLKSSKVFPNPSTGTVYVELPFLCKDKPLIVQVYDQKGVLQKQERFEQLKLSLITDIDLSTLSQGLYFIQLSDGEHHVSHKVSLVKD